jgi:predicted DNA-binding transcriptional regulator AlpA
MTKLLTLKETAERLRKSEDSLRWMMTNKTAPQSAKIGGRWMFREADVDAFIERQFEQEPTS